VRRDAYRPYDVALCWLLELTASRRPRLRRRLQADDVRAVLRRKAVVEAFIPTAADPPPVPARAAVSIANPWTTHGVLRIGVFRDIDSINPLLSGQAATIDIAQLIFWVARLRRSRESHPGRRAGGSHTCERQDQCRLRSGPVAGAIRDSIGSIHASMGAGRRFRRARRSERSLPALGESITRRAPSAAV